MKGSLLTRDFTSLGGFSMASLNENKFYAWITSTDKANMSLKTSLNINCDFYSYLTHILMDIFSRQNLRETRKLTMKTT